MAVYTEDDIQVTMDLVLKIIQRYNKKLIVDNIELRSISKEILNTIYDIGGSFDKAVISAVAEVKVKEKYRLD